MVTRKTHVPRTRSRSKQAGTEWTRPPGHAVSVGAGVPNETPASPLIELRLVDELLSLIHSSRWHRELAQVRWKRAREELAVDEQCLPRKGLTPALVGDWLKGRRSESTTSLLEEARLATELPTGEHYADPDHRVEGTPRCPRTA